MNANSVRQQIDDLLSRLIESSLSVKQFSPCVRTVAGGATVIGSKMSTSIALRNVSYDDIYRELDTNDAYDAKLVDGGLLLFQYTFNADTTLSSHRLAYFPSPLLPSADDAPELYDHDHLYGDIIERKLVRFPIRFDYAPSQTRDVVHPSSHLTLGQYENCRIPVSGPLSPDSFGMFIVRNFYCRIYGKHKNLFHRRWAKLSHDDTISTNERQLSHFVCGR